MGAPLDILFVTAEYPPAVGGVGDYTRQLARSLIAAGHWVTVRGGSSSAAEHMPGEPTVLPAEAVWNWQTMRRVARTSQQLAPDIVHIQYQTGAYSMHPAINLLPAWLRRVQQRSTIVVTAHDLRLPYLFPKADLIRTWITRRLFDDADAVIVTNIEDQQRVRGQRTADRTLFSPRSSVTAPIHCIPIGSNIIPQLPTDYDRASWRQQLGIAPDNTLVAYFGLLNRSKGVAELIEAIAGLPRSFKLVIIGGSAPLPDDQRYAAELQQLIAAKQLQHRVHLTGPCTEAEVSAHLQASDLVVLPFHDGASYRRGSLLAALAHGLPTITTTPRVPIAPALVDGVHAILTPHADAAVLQWVIERVAGDMVLRGQLAAGGHELAAHFSWPAIAAAHEQVYRTLLAKLVSGRENKAAPNAEP